MNDQELHAIYLVINSIPRGKVATYGQIAALASLPGKARIVGKILSRLPLGSTIPWHRVINAAGTISLTADSEPYRLQKEKLLLEGVIFKGTKVNLKNFKWQP
jgi:methylated-DNA-protein-cysteine methyltransferase-like protein